MSVSSLDSNSSSQPTTSSQRLISILEPIGYSTTSCGYCKEPLTGTRTKSNKSYGIWAHALSCLTYAELIDQGWRRSGKYLYKPDMLNTCCPQYTISLQVSQFLPSKNQKSLLKKFNHFIKFGGREGQIGWGRDEGDIEPSLNDIDDDGLEGVKGKGKGREDSQLSTALAVNYNPAPEPPAKDSTTGGSGIGGSNKRSKKNPVKKSPLGNNVTSTSEGVESEGGKAGGEGKAGEGKGKGKGQEKKKEPETLLDLLSESEWKNSPPSNPFKHKFEYTLESSSYTEEKYNLFREYQVEIHKEEDEKVTKKGFRRFLVDTPLDPGPSPSSSSSTPTTTYGSHHALYRIDGILIAFAVLDILPSGVNESGEGEGPIVSSVYFVWSPKWYKMSLGKISALREVGMVRDLERSLNMSGGEGGGEGGRYMMGFYIHTCPKMRYKSDYQPSSLLDPETNVYYPFESCKPLLDLNPHTSFSNPPPPSLPSLPLTSINSPIPIPASPPTKSSSNSEYPEADESEDSEEEEDPFPTPPPPGFLSPLQLPKSLILGTYVLEGKNLVPLMFSKVWRSLTRGAGEGQGEKGRRMIRECLAALGVGSEGKIAIWMG